MTLQELTGADIPAEETVVLPPARALRRNAQLAARLAALDAEQVA